MKEFLNKKVKIRLLDLPSDFWLDKYNKGIITKINKDGSFILTVETGIEYDYSLPKNWIVELDE